MPSRRLNSTRMSKLRGPVSDAPDTPKKVALAPCSTPLAVVAAMDNRALTALPLQHSDRPIKTRRAQSGFCGQLPQFGDTDLATGRLFRAVVDGQEMKPCTEPVH